MNPKRYYDEQYDFRKDWHDFDEKRMNRWLESVESEVWCWRHVSGFEHKPFLMLDIGCGIGRTAIWARKHHVEWRGVDISEMAQSMAVPDAEAKIMVGNAEKLPRKDGSVDIIVALGSLEHMDRPCVAMAEMARVLPFLARAVILVPNRVAILERLGLYHGTEQVQELRLPRREWERMITQAGFQITCVRKDYGPRVFKDWKPHKIIQRLLLKLTRFLPGAFAYVWIFDCRKGDGI